jgi:hypothetical protein
MSNLKAARALANTLRALEQELLDASDEEVLAAAAAIGLKPDMKGSIALAGVTQLVVVKARKPRGSAMPAKASRRRTMTSPPRKD